MRVGIINRKIRVYSIIIQSIILYWCGSGLLINLKGGRGHNKITHKLIKDKPSSIKYLIIRPGT